MVSFSSILLDKIIQSYKKKLRKKFFLKRNSFSRPDLEKRSFLIQKKLRKFIMDNNIKKIMFFYPIHNEVNLIPLIQELLNSLAYEIYFPKVENISSALPKKKLNYNPAGGLENKFTSQQIVGYRINSLKELQPGFKGILEPVRRNYPSTRVRVFDLVVVPGLAFTPKKVRLGYGGGFYDRYLKKFRPQFSIGTFFFFQKINFIPCHQNDIRIDKVITEYKIY